MPDNFDLWIAAALFLIVALVFIGTRIGVMPKKSIPVVTGAVFGALGIGLLAGWRRKAADAQIENLKKRIADRDKKIAELQTKRQLADEEVAAATTGLNNQLAAVQIQRAAIAKQLDADRGVIAGQSAGEAHAGLSRLLQEEAEFQRRTTGTHAIGGGGQ